MRHRLTLIAILTTASVLHAYAESPAGPYSKKLRTLIREAESSVGIPIKVEFFSPDSAEAAYHNGLTTYSESEVNIRAVAGVSREFDELVLAHEYYHVILHAKGFTMDYKRQIISDPKWTAAFTNIISNVTSCFTDKIVDRQLQKRGFNTALGENRFLETTSKMLRSEASSPNAGLKTIPILQKTLGMNFFCYTGSHRAPQFVQSLEASKLVSPAVAETEAALETGLRGVRYDTPRAYFNATKRLRDLLGFRELVILRRPGTREFQ